MRGYKMDHLTAIHTLNDMLLAEMPEYQPEAREFRQDTASQRRASSSGTSAVKSWRPKATRTPQAGPS